MNKIEQIITVGLNHMEPNDFNEPIGSGLKKYEDAIGFCWAWYIKCCFPSLYIATQVQVPHVNKSGGKNPCIDFVFNDKNDVGIELIRNGNKTVCEEHADRFEDKYKRWKSSGAILNFNITGNEKKGQLYESPKIPVYHFMKGENALYKGNKLLKQQVAKLPTPPLNREFCTMRHLGGKILASSLKYIR